MLSAVNTIAPPVETPVPVIAIGSRTFVKVPEILRAAPLLTIVPDAHDPEAVQVPVLAPKAVLLLIAKVPSEIVVLPLELCYDYFY